MATKRSNPVYSEEYNDKVRANAGFANPQKPGKRRKKPVHAETPREGVGRAATPGGIPRRR
jgi:hypothetical protein